MKPEIGIGYRKVRKGEKIPANHEFWAWGIGPWSNCPERTGDTYADHDRLCRVPLKNTTTKKPKEPKTMQTKKPGTTHGKPTAKGMKVEKKPATAKPKYPAARVQRELIAEAKPLEKRTKAELIETAQDLAVQFHNLAADHCIAGPKLDRALVDLKEAKAKIKELSKALEAAK